MLIFLVHEGTAQLYLLDIEQLPTIGQLGYGVRLSNSATDVPHPWRCVMEFLSQQVYCATGCE